MTHRIIVARARRPARPKNGPARPAVVRRRTVLSERGGVEQSAIPGIPLPGVGGIPQREGAHQTIPNFLGDDSRRRDRIALPIAGHECLMREPTLRQGQPVDQDVPPRGTGRRSVTGATSELATTSLMVNALAERGTVPSRVRGTPARGPSARRMCRRGFES